MRVEGLSEHAHKVGGVIWGGGGGGGGGVRWVE